MSGRIKFSKHKVVKEYLQRVDPYKKPAPIAYDLRGYADYVEKKGLRVNEISPEIMENFKKVSK